MGNDFSIDLNQIKLKSKQDNTEKLRKVDSIGDTQGFVTREPAKKRGRKPSPRTGQIHARVLPHVSDEIADESRRRGVTQGVIIEEAWKLYLNKSD